MSNTILFEQYLLKDVMPAMEAKYRIRATPDSRAMAGMSMGGEQSLAIGFGHPELFSSVGALSPSMPRELADRWASALADPKAANPQMEGTLDRLWTRDSSHLSASRKQHETLQQSAIMHTYVETEGAHKYALWQHHIAEFMPLLFR